MGEFSNITSSSTTGTETDDSGHGSASDGAVDAFSVEPTVTKRKRGRPPKNPGTSNQKTATDATKKSKVKKEGASEIANLLIAGFIEGTSEILKVDTTFTIGEENTIKPPLTRMIERMDISRVEKYSAIIDPLIIVFGLLMWSRRVLPKPESKQESKPDVDGITS